MREGLIPTRVNRLADISARIKEFVQEKSTSYVSPFQNEVATTVGRGRNRAKRSLTDWRYLYSKNHNKIVPSHTVYPATPDGDRIRCTMTGQCNRRKVFSSAKSKSFNGDRNFETRQSRRQKMSEAKRQSMVEFALAQNIYQNQILKDQQGQSNRDRRLYFAKKLDSKRSDYCKIGQYLSQMQPAVESATRFQPDPTQEYIKKINSNFKVKEYNLVKIKDEHKINNSRFIESLQLMNRRRKNLNSENGLRYYERQ